MGLFVRTGHAGNKFVQFYRAVETVLKKQSKLLDSTHKKICENILKEGDPFWEKVEAKSQSDYESMLENYLKKSLASFAKVEQFLEKQVAS